MTRKQTAFLLSMAVATLFLTAGCEVIFPPGRDASRLSSLEFQPDKDNGTTREYSFDYDDEGYLTHIEMEIDSAATNEKSDYVAKCSYDGPGLVGVEWERDDKEYATTTYSWDDGNIVEYETVLALDPDDFAYRRTLKWVDGRLEQAEATQDLFWTSDSRAYQKKTEHRFEYDKDGRVSSVDEQSEWGFAGEESVAEQTATTEYRYTDDGRIDEIEYESAATSGDESENQEISASVSYDDDESRIDEIKLREDGDRGELTFTYDDDGRIEQVETDDGVWEFEYEEGEIRALNFDLHAVIPFGKHIDLRGTVHDDVVNPTAAPLWFWPEL